MIRPSDDSNLRASLINHGRMPKNCISHSERDMHATLTAIAFEDSDLCATLTAMSADAVDDLDFGVIGFDGGGIVRLYNRHESEAAGLTVARVIGKRLFTEVAPCMNNFMVAQRFEDSSASGVALDATIDYVLTLRMRPTRVALRLITAPGGALSFLLVKWRAPE
jgi:photoactive yellow protein